MSQLSVILQESARRDTEVRTILGLLREEMEDLDGRRRSRISLKERLGFRGFACCGATWGFRPTTATISVRDDEEESPLDAINAAQNPSSRIPDPGCLAPNTPIPASSGMNLAAALAAERQFREASNNSAEATSVSVSATGTPARVSLMMRLLEEAECGGEVGLSSENEKGGGAGNDTVCCVCMVRKKGSAFIPCGHTFCRICSRELWLNRGSCPLCNRSILEILDIF